MIHFVSINIILAVWRGTVFREIFNALNIILAVWRGTVFREIFNALLMFTKINRLNHSATYYAATNGHFKVFSPVIAKSANPGSALT
jgi:hypothetical protein